MKKNLIILSFLLSGIPAAFSQLNFGIKAGYTSTLDMSNISSVATGGYDLNSVKNEVNNDFHIGGFGRFAVKRIYIQPELLYNIGKKQYAITMQDITSNTPVTYDKLITLSTIDIPIMIGYKILDLKLVNIRAYAGPKFRFNAGSSMDFKNITGGALTAADFKKDVKSSQVGLETGIGVDVLMFTLDARYSLIQDMYQTKIKSETIDNLPLSNLIISLGVKF
jgi:hypothetical protein